MSKITVELMTELEQARKDHLEAKVNWDFVNDKFMSEHEKEFGKMQATKLIVQQLEEEIRSIAMAEYKTQDTEKWFGKSVYVTNKTHIQYDPNKAIETAISQNLPQMLRLNKANADKLLMVLAPDWVTIEKSPQVSIAKKLTLPEPDE